MNEINLTYREATVFDAPSIVHQIEASKYNPEEIATSEAIEGTIKRWTGYIDRTHTPRFGKDPRVIYLAFDKDTLVGHVACHHTTKQGFESELQSIYVLPEYQSKGLGMILLSMAVDWLVNAGIKSMMVNIHSDNPYQRFYLKYGGVKAAASRYEWHDLNQLRNLARKARMQSPLAK